MNIRTAILTLTLMTPAAALATTPCDSPNLSKDDDGTWIDATAAIDGLIAAEGDDTIALAASLDAASEEGWLNITDWTEANTFRGAVAPKTIASQATDAMIASADEMMEYAGVLQQELTVVNAAFQASRANLIKAIYAMNRAVGTPKFRAARTHYLSVLTARQAIYNQARELSQKRTDVLTDAMDAYVGAPDVASIACVASN